MTTYVTDAPVLLDMTDYHKAEKRFTKYSIAGFVALAAMAVMTGVLMFIIDFRLMLPAGNLWRVTPGVLWVLSLATFAVVLVVHNKKAERVYTGSVGEASYAISSIILKKYDLDLIDPVVIDNRWEVVADGTPKKPMKEFRINSTPIRARYGSCGRIVDVNLTLSADRRDVTASVVTPTVQS